jgi:large subunit ribosomal protein L25
MSTVTNMRVQPRENSGRGASRALRLQGLVPAVIYGAGKDNVNIHVDIRDVVKGLQDPAFYTHVFDLDIAGKKETVLTRDIQFHPVTDNPIHVDFFRVDKNSRVHVAIPVHVINEDKSVGIKKGGVINLVIHNLEVVAPAHAIPESIVIDLSGQDIGFSVHSDTLQLPNGVTVAHPERDNTIMTLAAPTVQKAEDQPAGAAS